MVAVIKITQVYLNKDEHFSPRKDDYFINTSWEDILYLIKNAFVHIEIIKLGEKLYMEREYNTAYYNFFTRGIVGLNPVEYETLNKILEHHGVPIMDLEEQEMYETPPGCDNEYRIDHYHQPCNSKNKEDTATKGPVLQYWGKSRLIELHKELVRQWG